MGRISDGKWGGDGEDLRFILRVNKEYQQPRKSHRRARAGDRTLGSHDPPRACYVPLLQTLYQNLTSLLIVKAGGPFGGKNSYKPRD